MKKNYTNHIMAIVMIFLFFGNIALGQSVSITSFGSSITQDFNSLANTGSANTLTVNGWYLNEVSTSTTPTNIGLYAAGTGSSNTGDTYSFGVASSTERAFGGLLSGTFTPTIGASFTNNTGGTINSLAIAYTGEQWRLGTLSRVDRLDFQYSTDATNLTTGTWIDVDALDFTAPTTTGTVGALVGNTAPNFTNISSSISSLNIPNGATIWIRWNDFNASSSDDGLAIDDFSLTANGTISSTPNLTINDVTQTEGNSGTIDYNFTVSLSAPAPAGGVSFDIATADNTATIAGNDYVTNSLTAQTIPEGSDSYTFTVTVNGDSDVEPNETFFVNVTNIVGANAGDTQGQGTITNDDFGITKIHTIQGSGLAAALTGTQSVQGIVTKTFFGSGSLNGFYVQEEDSDADADPVPSEGIFVFNPPSQPNVGDKVTVTGTVIDFGTTQPLTEFSPTTSVTLISTGNTLPAAVPVQLPVTEVNDLERYESMLVTLTAATGNLVVTENFELGRFGQIVLAANDPATNAPGTDARIDQYTQFNMPSVAGNTEYQAAIKKRIIYVDDANTQQNIDPIKFGRGGNPLSASNTLRTGDEVASVTAVLDQRFEGYRLQIGSSSELNILPTNERPATPNLTGTPTLVAGNMNVLNYFNGDGLGGGFPTARGANTPAEFTRQRDKIIAAIVNSGADILSLNEIENDGYGAESAIQDLVNGLNAATVPGTWAFITPPTGVVTATDQITCAMIYKPGKATPIGGMAALTTGEYVEVGRAAIAQTFKQNSNNAKFTLVGGHFKSKGSLNAGPGNPDIGDGQGNNNGQRTRQAEQLATWLATDPTGSGDPDILIVGDLNSYAKEDPITKLENEGYAKLIANTNTSYQFDGAHGALDHALGNASLQAQVVDAVKWHINADEPTALDYNTEFKTPGHITSLYNADQFRNSDHDPVIVGLNLTCDEITYNETVVTACVSYTWANNGQTYTESGPYLGTTTNCVTEKLILTITPKPATEITTASICSTETYTWEVNGVTYSSSTSVTIVGDNCTADQVLNLTVTPKPATEVTTANICSTETYTWAVNNQTYNTSTTVTIFGENCTADKVLNLIVTPKPASEVTTVNICSSETYTWAVNGQSYSTSTSITIIGDNCTADKVLDLTVTPTTETITTESQCDSYSWAVTGQTYNTSGTYTHVIGCHTETLNLTIIPSTETATIQTSCDSYTWSVTGQTYNTSGTYIKVDGCHTEKLVLTIVPSTETVTTISNCDSYTWSVTGQTYSISGTYTKITGCHTDKLVLTITPSTSSTTTISACGSYLWAANGQTYTTSGTYNFVNNCNTQVLVLTIKSAGNISGQAVMCKGSNFIFTSSIAGGTWSSSNNSVATVGNNGNNKGKVNAINYGVAIISYTVNGCTSTFNLTVGDNIAPVISCPSSITKALNGSNNCNTKINIGAPVVTDNCGGITIGYVLTGATTGSGAGAVGNKTFNVGITNIVYTATDAVGNSSTCSTTVTVTNTSCTSSGRISAENISFIEPKEFGLLVKGNPSSEEFIIEISTSEKLPIGLSIIGINGHIFESFTSQEKEIKIGKNLNEGIYFLRATQGKNSKIVKLIKSRNQLNQVQKKVLQESKTFFLASSEG